MTIVHFIVQLGYMLIDTKNLISVSQLRGNLADIMDEVRKGTTMYISERGDITAKLSPLLGDKKQSKKNISTPVVKQLEGILENKKLSNKDDYIDYLITKYA